MVCVETPAWLDMLAAYARAASDPLKRPAIAAPVITALDGLVILVLFVWFLFPLLRDVREQNPLTHPSLVRRSSYVCVLFRRTESTSASGFRQYYESEVLTCFVGTHVDRSKPIAILTAPGFD